MDHPRQSTHSNERPRSRARTFSLRSDKSNEAKTPTSPSHAEMVEKARRDSFFRGESKANPNAAIKEAEPGVVATYEKTTLSSIRDVEHRDLDGNVIVDPDLSNPTRSRWERPLDTIRNFERAIDGGYRRRGITRAETYDNNNQYASRRSSYFGGYDNGPQNSRSHGGVGGGYYSNRRPESSHYDYATPSAPPHRQHYHPRFQSDSNIHRMHPGYGGYANSNHGYQQSYETFNTGVTPNSDSTGPWANSTDPSSENSSLDRVNAVKQLPPPPPQEQMNTYGLESFGGAPIMEEFSGHDEQDYDQRMRRPVNGYGYNQNGGPPASQNYRQAPPQSRQPIPLTNAYDSYNNQNGGLPSAARQKEEKRKSWIKRRFSRNG